MATSSVFPTPVTQEEFNLFHSIDRNLYTRLIIDLGRDPGESMQIIALWIWLERLTHEQIISKILSLPLTLVNALADEAVVCLNCVELDHFPLSVDNNVIPLLQSLLKMEVSLCFFHENRLQIVRGVTKIVNDVCSRAFQDIVMRAFHVGNNQLINPMMNVPVFYPTFGVFPNMTSFEFGESSNRLGASNAAFTPQVTVGGKVLFEPYDLEKQRRVLNSRDVAEVFKGLTISSYAEVQEEKEVPVPPKDRTIFVTFSKGYPLSETEVRDFFTR